jgi:uncharacterized protein involved in exopolysaccharide biosynthesis
MSWEIIQQVGQTGMAGIAGLLALALRRLYLDGKAKDKAAAEKDKEVSELLESRYQKLLDLTRECVENSAEMEHLINEIRELRQSNRRDITELRQQLGSAMTELRNRNSP